MAENFDEWAFLLDEMFNCKKCELYKTRKNVVIYRGNLKAKILLIGEGPGQREDEQGKPFVGLSGYQLDKILEKIGLNLEKDIIIVNTIKCRPPNNRNPNVEELRRCTPYLDKQIKLINPEIIITLGKVAGEWFNINKTDELVWSMNQYYPNCKWLPIYHPRYLMQNKEARYQAYKAMKETLTKLELIC